MRMPAGMAGRLISIGAVSVLALGGVGVFVEWPVSRLTTDPRAPHVDSRSGRASRARTSEDRRETVAADHQARR